MAVFDSSPVHLIWDSKTADAVNNHYEYNPGLGRETSLRAHKQLPRRRDVEDDLFVPKTRHTISRKPLEPHDTGSESTTSIATVIKSSPNPGLPLTPPTVHPESDIEDEIATPVTPTLQKPPTPDHTPPRKVLASQLSFASTRAESFRTAREDFVSDDDFEPAIFTSNQRRSPGTPSSIRQRRRRPSPLTNGTPHSIKNGSKIDDLSRYPEPAEIALPQSRATSRSTASTPQSQIRTNATVDEPKENGVHVQPWMHAHTHTTLPSDEPTLPTLNHKRRTISPESQKPVADTNGLPQRGLSLRERVLEARQNMIRRSTEDFGDAIGWSKQNEDTEESFGKAMNSWRRSTASAGSAIEAYVVVDNTPKRQQTLRHIGKNLSLRSASSPIPAPNRDLGALSDDTPLRSFSVSGSPTLHHKKARLSDQCRWSYGSEVSRSFSMASSGVVPRTETEVIKVAVIPERGSSLRSSANSSRRVSVMSTGARNGSGDQYPPSSYHARENSGDLPYRRRTLSDTNGSPMPRGRDRQQPPVIPPRASSLSAPTSKSNSRANSMSSTSDQFRHRRIAAEKDLRKTLDQMESERLIPTLRSLQADRSTLPDRDAVETTPSRPAPKLRSLFIEHQLRRSSDQDANGATPTFEPGSTGWATLRPSSVLDTPFSQPSNVSMSPGPVEMGEARAVNFFPHNNDSVQLIEKHPMMESRPVREVQQRLLADEPSTPSTTTQVRASIDSPLRNPRRPPEPPQLTVVPPTPGADSVIRQPPIRAQTVLRPSLSKRRYSESFVKSLTRNLSLKNARNRKADQELDGKLHPFWRPRGFWDGISDSDNDDENPDTHDRGLVANSLGFPQERTVITGPMSLMRRLSSRRGRPARTATLPATTALAGGIEKKSSYSSLQKIRAGRRLHTVPGLGLRFQIIGLRDIQDRMLRAKQRKEDERRDRRREDLRRSIGANVISRGDSRFPATATSTGRQRDL